MAESEAALSPLDGVYRAGTIGVVAESGPAVQLRERRGLTFTLVAGPDDAAFCQAVEDRTGIALPKRPNTAAERGHRCALWTGPGQWLIVSTDGFPEAIEAAVRDIPAATSVAVTDISQGRAVVRIEGAAARHVLAKGCSLDLHPRSFVPGDCAQTHLGAIGVLLHAQGEGSLFDLYVPRSYALSAWEWLIDAAAEFGCRVADPA